MSGKITYAKTDGCYIIRFIGEIRYTDCPALDTFLKKLFVQEDLRDIMIDLTETENIDSTNLGFLAKITNFMQERFNKKAVIVSTNEDINRTLDSVGFSDVFNIIEQLTEMVNEEQIENNGSSELTPQIIYEAHQILSNVNEENRQMFQDVLEQMKKEIDSEL
jgi:anti-anti-sigma factor